MSNSIYPNAIRGLTWPVKKTPENSTVVQKAVNGYTVRVVQMQNPLWHWSLVYDYIKDNPNDVLSALGNVTDYRYLEGFWLARQGRYDDFLFDDLYDDTVGPFLWKPDVYVQVGQVLIDPSGHKQTAQNSGFTGAAAPSWNDSGSTTLDGQVTWQDGGLSSFSGIAQTMQIFNDGTADWFTPLQRNFGGQFFEDITDLNTTMNPLRVWANGMLTTDYTQGGPGLAIPGASFMGLYIAWKPWQGTTHYNVGQIFIDPAGHAQKVTVSGTTSSVEPSWNDTGGTTIDGGVTWQDEGLAVITASFGFYFRVRFDMDQQDFEQTMQQLWTIGGTRAKSGSGTIELVSSRTPTT